VIIAEVMKKYIISILAIIAVALVVCASWLLNHNNGSKKSQREIAVYEKELFIKSMFPDERFDGHFGTIEFCGVSMGMNIKWIGNENDKIPKSITLLTTRQDLKTFEQLKEGISSYLGNPQSDKYELDDDNRVYGRVEWNKGFSVTLRHIHSDEGGLMIIVM
jgi:hypothetical protein